MQACPEPSPKVRLKKWELFSDGINRILKKLHMRRICHYMIYLLQPTGDNERLGLQDELFGHLIPCFRFGSFSVYDATCPAKACQAGSMGRMHGLTPPHYCSQLDGGLGMAKARRGFSTVNRRIRSSSAPPERIAGMKLSTK